MNLPRSGSEARKLGVSKYETGRPCHLGHFASRYTQSGVCTECAPINSSRHRKTEGGKKYARDFYVHMRTELPEKIMWQTARARAKKVGVPFSVTPDHILSVWPADDICPVLGLQMEHNFDSTGYVGEMSPTLDRMKPSLGYVPGNIIVMSQRANRLKGDEVDPAIFRMMANWLERN